MKLISFVNYKLLQAGGGSQSSGKKWRVKLGCERVAKAKLFLEGERERAEG